MDLTITIDDEVLKRARLRALEEDTSVNAVVLAFPVRDLTSRRGLAALRRSQDSRLPYWDALIVETARDAGARVLLTEDLQDGRDFGGLRVRNPFRTRGERTPPQ
jgi:predicted nucleic acid-binding protein